MLRPRLIPCLLVENGGLVKTVGFKAGKYVGDPLNAVRIFNEKQVDELAVLDISATMEGREPDYPLIKALAAECRMPLCYGGGITRAEQVERIISSGVEKVAISSAAVAEPELVARAAEQVGSQSVVVVIDAKKTSSTAGYEVFTHRGERNSGKEAAAFARQVEALGAGEIVINAIDRDGVMQGYDLDLIEQVKTAVGCPLTVLGGAGSLADVAALYRRFGLIGAACGSLFVFKGKYRAVLINYPDYEEKQKLVAELPGHLSGIAP